MNVAKDFNLKQTDFFFKKKFRKNSIKCLLIHIIKNSEQLAIKIQKRPVAEPMLHAVINKD
jgi:hypothetical protein